MTLSENYLGPIVASYVVAGTLDRQHRSEKHDLLASEDRKASGAALSELHASCVIPLGVGIATGGFHVWFFRTSFLGVALPPPCCRTHRKLFARTELTRMQPRQALQRSFAQNHMSHPREVGLIQEP